MRNNILRYGFLTGLILALSRPAFAQLDNSALSDRITVNEADSNTWGFGIQSFNYLRNTEYFNDIELGRTLFGYQLQPTFFIQPNPHVKIQGGVWVRHDFGGENPFTEVLPVFSLKLQNKRHSFTFGTLEGALSHKLIEPLQDINSAIERRIENGAQYQLNSRRIILDTWINWEKFIERGSPYKEQFTAGLNVGVPIIKTESGFSLIVPLQALAHHKGGQIDTDTSNMIMQLNGATGLVAVKGYTSGFISYIRLMGHVVGYRENTNSGFFPYREGSGVYGNFGINARNGLGVLVSYWNGNRFLAPRGSAIYASQSIDKPAHTEKNRELVFLRLLYQKEIYKDLDLVARFEPVYDLRNSIFDYSYSLYLVYRFNKGFRL